MFTIPDIIIKAISIIAIILFFVRYIISIRKSWYDSSISKFDLKIKKESIAQETVKEESRSIVNTPKNKTVKRLKFGFLVLAIANIFILIRDLNALTSTPISSIVTLYSLIITDMTLIFIPVFFLLLLYILEDKNFYYKLRNQIIN